MKKQILSLAAAFAALSLNSCLQDEGTINLNKDGSGTIVEQKTMSAQALAMMSLEGSTEISVGTGEEKVEVNNPLKDEDIDPLKNLLSEERAKKRAKALGEGVTFVKAEPVTVGTYKGARITYRFADINKVRIGSIEGLDMMNSEMDDEEEKTDNEDKIGFNYANGVLTVKPNFDLNAKGAEGGNAGEEVADEEIEMMKMVLADMKIGYKVKFESGIAETNATHREKDTVTILEIDMNKVMEKPDGLKKLYGLDHVDPAKAMKEINTIDGLKAETKPEITIKLK
jgi:hypothetical protein